MGFTEFYWVLLCFTEFELVSIRLDEILLGFTGFYWVYQVWGSFIGFQWIVTGWNECWQGFTGVFNLILGLIGLLNYLLVLVRESTGIRSAVMRIRRCFLVGRRFGTVAVRQEACGGEKNMQILSMQMSWVTRSDSLAGKWNRNEKGSDSLLSLLFFDKTAYANEADVQRPLYAN